MWPSGAPRRGKIAESARGPSRAGRWPWPTTRPGRAVVDAALAADEPVPAEVFDGLVATLSRWGWPAGRPTWVTWVPSRAHAALLADLAAAPRRRSAGCRSPTPLSADGPGFQRDAAHQRRVGAPARCSRLSIAGDVPAGPVLLLDDTTRSGFTLTVAAALLREAGAGPVYPLVLHKVF